MLEPFGDPLAFTTNEPAALYYQGGELWECHPEGEPGSVLFGVIGTAPTLDSFREQLLQLFNRASDFTRTPQSAESWEKWEGHTKDLLLDLGMRWDEAQEKVHVRTVARGLNMADPIPQVLGEKRKRVTMISFSIKVEGEGTRVLEFHQREKIEELLFAEDSLGSWLCALRDGPNQEG